METISSAAREAGEAFKDVVRSELKLAALEAKEAGQHYSAGLRRLGLSLFVAVMGVPPLLAFLVVGLGRLLGEQYWLSALIVSVAFLTVGGVSAWRAWQVLKGRELGLPRTREAIEQELFTLKEKAQEIAENTKRRVA